MKALLYKILEKNKKDLIFYSPYNFIRILDSNYLVEETLIKPLENDILQNRVKLVNIDIDSQPHIFVSKYLDWDTNYFGFPVYKLELIIYNHHNKTIINKAIKKFVAEFINENEYYFIDIPCEDILLTQAFCNTGFQLIETRLNYVLSDLQNCTSVDYPVRIANKNDIESLAQVAAKMRNRFDRVHADDAFTNEIADAYLGTFISQCIKGFADIVLVPDISGVQPFGFLAANKPQNILGNKVAKLVLAGVDSSVQRGWLMKLLHQMILFMKDENADYLTTITQAANRPAIAVWEKAGFKLNHATYIFSIKKHDRIFKPEKNQ